MTQTLQTAIGAAAEAITKRFITENGRSPNAEELMLIGRLARHAVETAEPYITAAERQHIADDYRRRSAELRGVAETGDPDGSYAIVANVLANEAWNLTHEREVVNLTEPERIHDERCCMNGAHSGWGPHPDCPGLDPAWPVGAGVAPGACRCPVREPRHLTSCRAGYGGQLNYRPIGADAEPGELT